MYKYKDKIVEAIKYTDELTSNSKYPTWLLIAYKNNIIRKYKDGLVREIGFGDTEFCGKDDYIVKYKEYIYFVCGDCFEQYYKEVN